MVCANTNGRKPHIISAVHTARLFNFPNLGINTFEPHHQGSTIRASMVLHLLGQRMYKTLGQLSLLGQKRVRVQPQWSQV